MSEFDEFWSLYKVKKGKKKAETTFNRLTKYNKNLAIIDIKTRYKYVEIQYIPHPTTYINGERWNDEREAVEGEKTPIKPLELCCSDNCSNEIHGPSYLHCINHLPPPETEVLKMMREHYKDNGMVQKDRESNREHSLRLRKQYMSTMFDSLHPPIKSMKEFK